MMILELFQTRDKEIPFAEMAPIFFHLNTVVFDLNALTSNLACLLLAVLYVGSLYLWHDGKDR